MRGQNVSVNHLNRGAVLMRIKKSVLLRLGKLTLNPSSHVLLRKRSIDTASSGIEVYIGSLKRDNLS